MSQPIWRCVANIGDRTPLDHGGLFVYVDRTGKYAPELERVERADESEDGALEVRRVVLDRCTYINGVLSDNEFHPDFPAWYAKDIERVAECMDVEPDELREDLCGDDPVKRAQAYRCILDYFGWDNGDEYPLTLTMIEARKRYRNELRRIRRGTL